MSCRSGKCVLKRDRGIIDPWDVSVGDAVLEVDPDCPEHGKKEEDDE